MKTEFLIGLGIDKQIANKVLAQNGKDIAREQAKSQTKIDEFTALEQRNTLLEEENKALRAKAAECEFYKAGMVEARAREERLQEEFDVYCAWQESQQNKRDAEEAEAERNYRVSRCLRVRLLAQEGAIPDLVELLLDAVDLTHAEWEDGEVLNYEELVAPLRQIYRSAFRRPIVCDEAVSTGGCGQFRCGRTATDDLAVLKVVQNHSGVQTEEENNQAQ